MGLLGFLQHNDKCEGSIGSPRLLFRHIPVREEPEPQEPEPFEEADWQEPETQEQSSASASTPDLSLQKVSEDLIQKALEKHNGNRKLAAAELGISERTLYRRLSKEMKR